jgi:hypothetical protein
MPTGKKAVTVYFDDQLYQRVTAAAKADRRSVANFIEAAVDCMISRNGPARFRVNGPTLHGLPAEPRFESFTRPFS